MEPIVKTRTLISDARWPVYDIPGNAGWIIYIVCLVLCLREWVNVFSVLAVIPALLMLTSIMELISDMA